MGLKGASWQPPTLAENVQVFVVGYWNGLAEHFEFEIQRVEWG